jgi:hypothetical protein
MQLGAAFTAVAAQHSWKAPATKAALLAVDSLLRIADRTGITNSAGSSSLGSNIRQQLQQSGMLQQLAAVMTALSADLQAATAACAAGSGEADQIMSVERMRRILKVVMHVHGRMMDMYGVQSPDLDTVAWLCHPSGHAAAGMQLITAVLQQASVLTQHLLPGLRQRLPQQAEGMLAVLQSNVRTARALGASILADLTWAHVRQQQQGQGDGVGALQQLLSSPHLLTCAAALAVLSATHVSGAVAAQSGQVGGSSGGNESGAVQHVQQDAAHGSSSNSSRSSAVGSANPTACQLRLLKLLGLAPEVITWAGASWDDLTVCQHCVMAANACANWCVAVVRSLPASGMGPGNVEQQLQAQQRWQFEQQLMMLLPTVLLPCASSLLSPGACLLGQQVLQQALPTVQHLLQFSNRALVRESKLYLQLGSLGRPTAPTAADWVHELMEVVLQLVDQLLLVQQPLKPACQAPATSASSSAQGSSTSSSPGDMAEARAMCVAQLPPLLWTMLQHSQSILYEPSSSGSSSGNSTSSSSRNHATGAAPSEACRFVRLGPAAEAVLRAVTAAVQSGMVSMEELPVGRSKLITDVLLCHPDHTRSLLVQHMGLCGPEVLPQEQRQLYSLLSTVLKLGHGSSEAFKPCWGERAAGSCCLASGQAAARLLLPSSGSEAEHPQCAADLLPSLVILGRCCLQWAEQLQQQAPELLLLASAALQPEQCQIALLHDHSAALVCIPGLRQVAGRMPADRMESLLLAVSEWVSGLESTKAVAQLQAAACAPQQLQQQLDALLTTQQGVQQGLTDATMTALVQQLQATGSMLCNIAVPHFCNNPACANISGFTEVQLVSGRSCVCAGCRTARYCGRDCQRVAWQQHKPVCKALAAAAGATAATAGV